MPKRSLARAPAAAREERRIRRRARRRLGPRDRILRARLVAPSWAGRRVPGIAAGLGCHPETGRARRARFAAAGVDGRRDRPRPGRARRIAEAARGGGIALVAAAPPGRRVRDGAGVLEPRCPARRRRAEGVRWRRPRARATSVAPESAPQGRRA